MNKKFFDSIPVVGGLIGGGLTFLSFKPCCLKLKEALTDTMLSNPEHVSSADENEIFSDIVGGKVYDVEYEESDSEDTQK